ncbi:Abi family protein [Lacticaseibacillus paracasei]|uniref:Abi family protein n=2 Tax=Lacticaseibacillus paracasei TaxID=1597 RepID=UPI000E08FCBE|nr:Abi family protein [Lacticaseibacillus paracasei]RDG24880.1 Abi family protein [Lacticaseibacillus paracasei]RDG25489.1 Abi family protein [Lacticaseibacillus paracasei]
MKADKPFKTYGEQIAKLSDHNIIVPNGQEAYVKSMLMQYGYYNLVNAYQDKLEHTDDEKFCPERPFNLFSTIKQIDEILSGILLPLVIHFENTFETSLSYHVAETFGVFHKGHPGERGYLSPKNYPRLNMSPTPTLRKLREFATGLHKTKHDGQDETEPSRFRVSASLEMYREKHNHVPPWILVNDISFGLAARWYTICPPKIKRAVLEDLYPRRNITDEEALKLLRDGLDIAQDFRNTIAHGTSILKTRLSYPTSDSKLSPSVIGAVNDSAILSSRDYANGYGQSDIFSLLLVLAIFTNEYEGLLSALRDIGNLNRLSDSEFIEIQHMVMNDIIGFPPESDLRIKKLIEFCRNK